MSFIPHVHNFSGKTIFETLVVPVADPGAPGGEASCKGGGANLLLWPNVQKKLFEMKKKIGPRGRRAIPGVNLDSSMRAFGKELVS